MVVDASLAITLFNIWQLNLSLAAVDPTFRLEFVSNLNDSKNVSRARKKVAKAVLELFRARRHS